MSEIPIKSVKRVFEILEYFDQQRRPLAAKEVAAKLGYPLMSAHALMKSMHYLGYLDFDQPDWTYTPSRNFLDVLDWAYDFLERETEILDLIKAVNHETKETVNLSRRTQAHVKILHGHETLEVVGVSVKAGTEMPITQSLTGLTALACLSKREFTTTWSRLERSNPEYIQLFDRELLDQISTELAACGTVAGYDFFVDGISAVCMPVKAKMTKETLIIGVVGPTNRIRSNETAHRNTLVKLANEYGVTICPPGKPFS